MYQFSVQYGTLYGILYGMGAKTKNQKVTAIIPAAVVARAMKASGENLRQTVQQGLELVALRNVYKELRALQGSLKNAPEGLGIDLETSRKDREE